MFTEDERFNNLRNRPLRERLKEKLKGMKLFRELIEKSKKSQCGADLQVEEALNMLELYNKSGDETLLKGVKFHRSLAKSGTEEAQQYFIAASEVARRFDIDKATKQEIVREIHEKHGRKRDRKHIKQSNIKNAKRVKGGTIPKTKKAKIHVTHSTIGKRSVLST